MTYSRWVIITLCALVCALPALAQAPVASPSPTGAAPVFGPIASNPQIADLNRQIADLQTQIRTLRGRNEELEFALAQARQAAVNDRATIQDLTNRNASLAQQIGQLEANAAPAGDGAASNEGTNNVPISSSDAFLRARNQLLNKDYETARASFEDFIKTYPKDGQTPDAYYYLGEARYLQGDAFAEAAEAYLMQVQKFPKSARAPDSFVKLAASLRQIGANDRACAALKDFSRRYPNAQALTKTRAASESRAAGCKP